MKKYIQSLFLPQEVKNKRLFLAWIAAIVIWLVIWQVSFAKNPKKIDSTYLMQASIGMNHECNFLYFFYYLDLFPVATTQPYPDYSKQAAEDVLNNHGDWLVTELHNTIRYGDIGKIFLYLPHAYLTGSAKECNIRLTNQSMFIMSLLLLFGVFCWIKQPLLGFFLVLLVGSYPFQLLEIYRRPNIFGWPIITAVFLLAINLPFFTTRKKFSRYLFLIPILSGLFLACVKQIRTEPVALMASIVLIYFFMENTKFITKISLIVLLLGSYLFGVNGIEKYFSYKIEESTRIVQEVGGNPYLGPRDKYHMVWHPIWCGLGDFDTKYGYVWSDVAAAKYAEGVLRERYGISSLPNLEFCKWEGAKVEEFWDEGNRYYKTPFEVPHYDDVIREKVLSDIMADPLWYMSIIAKRIKKVLTELPSVRISLPEKWITLPYHWTLFVFVVAMLFYIENWFLLKVIIFVLPLAATSIFVYSGQGTINYNIYHVVVMAIFLTGMVQGVGNFIFKSKEKR